MFRKRLVDPDIQKGKQLDIPSALLSYFSDDAVLRRLPGFEFASWQFPLFSLVAQERHTAVAAHHTLDGIRTMATTDEARLQRLAGRARDDFQYRYEFANGCEDA